ncbi:dihydropteroate synthase [Clostridium ihumii]|uniref:dihydropteroate synthase n=1 Tax=Clostridium ihumii TaxID=1470356 RepID=UPI003D337214
MKIEKKNFDLDERTIIMGILNVTPDSFSDGGNYNTIENAVKRALEMIEEGVDIIDIGGESTRPGHKSVGLEEELERVIPIIKAIREVSDIPISVDTYKGKVAEEAIKNGASLINDVWGFKKDEYIAEVAGKYNVPCCLMHNREDKNYNDIIEDMIVDLQKSIDIAIKNGVKKENIILDPGIGFAKTYEDNLVVMKNLKKIKEMGYPVLLGTSRKSFIGKALNIEEPKDRVEGTMVTTVMGIMSGCEFVRVHDVKANKRTAMMTEAILKCK